MLQFSLVFMLQERGPRQKTRLMTDIITFGVGNSTILNQDGKMKILSHVACFYSKCLAKIVFWWAASWLKTSHALWGHLLTVSCMRITQLHANTLPATARGIKEKTSEKRLGVKRFHFMCVSKDLKWKIGGRGEEILVGGREERLHYCYPAKTAVSPRTSPLGTFCKKERLRLSDRNPILMT